MGAEAESSSRQPLSDSGWFWALMFSVMALVMNPGATAFTVMPRLPTSCASDLVRPMSPALEAT